MLESSLPLVEQAVVEPKSECVSCSFRSAHARLHEISPRGARKRHAIRYAVAECVKRGGIRHSRFVTECPSVEFDLRPRDKRLR